MYRRNLRHSRVNNLFKFTSLKMNTVLTVESFLEFDACFHLEYSGAVKRFEAQPEGFYYFFNGKNFPYTPDFLVIDYDNKPYFLEVKPSEHITNTDFLQRFPAKQQEAIKMGSPLKLVTEKQIRESPVLNNLKLLHRYAGFQSTTTLHEELLVLIKASDGLTLSKLCELTGTSQGEVLACVLSLIARGSINSNLHEKDLGITTLVWVQ